MLSQLHTLNRARMRRALWDGTVNVGYYERMASAVGGPLLALYGLSRRSPGGLGLALIGGLLFERGMTGHCHVYQALGVSTAAGQRGPLHVEKSVTINRPPEELYRFWHNFENLPRFMKHLESVHSSDDRRSHWVAIGPAGMKIEWDAEMTEDQPGTLIAWRALPGADVDNAGTVRFEPAAGGRGTLVRVAFDYNPPAGALGAATAKLFGEEPSQQLEGDLRRFKEVMEAGEIPTTEGQPSGRRSALGAMLQPEHKPAKADTAIPDRYEWMNQGAKSRVQEASEQSFPASDPPGWTSSKAGGLEEKEAGA